MEQSQALVEREVLLGVATRPGCLLILIHLKTPPYMVDF